MRNDEPSGDRLGGSASRHKLENLSDADRREYEEICERLEERFDRPDTPISELLAEAPAEPPVRDFVLIYLGKLWLDSERERGAVPELESFLKQVPELRQLDWALSELQAWEQEIRRDLPEEGAASTSVEYRGGKFELPGKYKYLHTLQDNPHGMSLVLLVENRPMGRKEVLKAIIPSRRGEARAVRRFLDEPRRAGSTMHPGIIRVWDASSANCPCPYYTMEYLEGGSLADLLKAGPIPISQSVRYIAIVARALHHIHTVLDFAHRDIKPDNILLDKEGNPKLSDFGLSREMLPEDDPLHEERGSTTEIEGTAGFIAPEQLDSRFRPAGYSENQLRIASDLFALGATLYYCLSRHLPYQQGTTRPAWNASLTNELIPVQQLNPAVDNKLDAIVEMALQKRIEHRFSNAAEFADAIESWLAEKPVRPGKPPADSTFEPGPLFPTGVSRHRIWRIIGAVAAILLIAFVSLNYLRSGESVVGPDPAPPRGDGEISVAETTPRTPFEQLREKGWEDKAAKSVLELNGPWWKTVREVNPRYADDQIDRLARLGNSSITLDFCSDSPHRAAMLTTLSTRDEHQNLASVLKTDDAHLADHLFTLFPAASETQPLVRMLKEEAELMREISRLGWLGCEVALLRPGENEAEKVYNDWLRWIVKERLVPARTDEARKLAAEFQAYAMIEGPKLRLRLRENPEFRGKFLDHYWRAFVDLLDEKVFTLTDVLQVDVLWDYLDKEGEAGVKLLELYKLAPVALLYGPHAEDFDGMHDSAIELLESGNKSVVNSLFEEQFRGVPAYKKLLGMNIGVEYLGAALDQARKNPGLLNDYADRTAEYLKNELAPWVDANAPEPVEGRLTYVSLPLKYMAGQDIYTREKEALFRQGVADVSAAVMAYFGASNELKESFDAGYWGTIAGADAVAKENRQKYLEESRIRYDRGELPDFETAKLLVKPADLSLFLEQTQSIMALAVKPEDMRASREFDVAAVARMYKVRLDCNDPNRNAADRREVRLTLLENEQFAITIHGKANPIRKFFNSRSEIMADVANVPYDKRELAWRESVSAWWLMHASGQLDLLDSPSTAPAHP